MGAAIMTNVAETFSPPSTPALSPAAVGARALGKSIDDRPILRNLNFSIPAGSYVALLGANGAGKSTLMRMISMLTGPTAGDLTLFGTSVRKAPAALRKRLGLISHQAMLYRDLSPRENLVLFGKLYGIPDPAGRAMDLLSAVGLAHRADDPVKGFSRGMTQRTAIARALMHDPELILADEPFAGLDAPSMDTVERILAMLHSAGRTIVLANHDIAQTLRLTQRALVLRQGELVMDAPTAGLDAQSVLKEISA